MNTDFQLMIDYTTAVLRAIAEFLGSSPMIYLFGLICGCFVIKMLKSLMSL